MTMHELITHAYKIHESRYLRQYQAKAEIVGMSHDVLATPSYLNNTIFCMYNERCEKSLLRNYKYL